MESIIQSTFINTRIKNTLIYLLKLTASFFVLYFLLRNIQADKLANSFLNANYGFVICGVIFGIINIYLQFCKWRVICFHSFNESEEKTIWYSLFYGFAGAIITPFRVGEYAGRSIGIPGADIVKISIGTLADHFFSIVVICFAGSASVLIYLKFLNYINDLTLILFILAEAIFVILIKWLIINGGLLKSKVIKQLKYIRLLKELSIRAESFNGLNINIRLQLLLFSLLAFLCYTIQYSLFLAALTNEWSIQIYFLIGILTIFAKTIIPPFTVGDFGIRESASVFFATQFGISAALGFNASLLLYFLNVAVPAMVGVFLLLKRK